MPSLIEQAIHLETTAAESYRKAAQATSDPSAGKILDYLADEEDRHATALRALKDVSDTNAPNLVQLANSWIRGVIEGGESAISHDKDLLDALKRAMAIEQMTASFYREHALSSDDAVVQALFTQLAEIENTHFLLIGSLVEYFDRPNEWIESAEFGLREDY